MLRFHTLFLRITLKLFFSLIFNNRLFLSILNTYVLKRNFTTFFGTQKHSNGVLKQVLLPIILPIAILAWALHQKNGKANVKLRGVTTN